MPALNTSLEGIWKFQRTAAFAVQILDVGRGDFRDDLSSEPTKFPNLGIPGLKLRFDDGIDRRHPHCFTTVQAQLILDHVQDISAADLIAVHCFAGVGRSAAVAAAINFLQGDKNPWPALNQHTVDNHRPGLGISPNELITETIDRVWEFNGEFAVSLFTWLDARPPLDYSRF